MSIVCEQQQILYCGRFVKTVAMEIDTRVEQVKKGKIISWSCTKIIVSLLIITSARVVLARRETNKIPQATAHGSFYAQLLLVSKTTAFSAPLLRQFQARLKHHFNSLSLFSFPLPSACFILIVGRSRYYQFCWSFTKLKLSLSPPPTHVGNVRL